MVSRSEVLIKSEYIQVGDNEKCVNWGCHLKAIRLDGLQIWSVN